TRSDRDWSSDVCSSDLSRQARELSYCRLPDRAANATKKPEKLVLRLANSTRSFPCVCVRLLAFQHDELRAFRRAVKQEQAFIERSEERRVGNECRSRVW